MSARLANAFPSDRAALVCFVTAGDPTPAATPAILDALVEGGADVIELGMPFTDPMADGPAIQAANLRSLAAGTKTADILAIATDLRLRARLPRQIAASLAMALLLWLALGPAAPYLAVHGFSRSAALGALIGLGLVGYALAVWATRAAVAGDLKAVFARRT